MVNESSTIFSNKTGNVSLNTFFEVEVMFPTNIPSLNFQVDKALETVNSFYSVKQIIQQICTDHKMPNSHLVSLALKDQVLHENECLTQYGLGSTFQTCTLRIIPKKYPTSNGNTENGNTH